MMSSALVKLAAGGLEARKRPLAISCLLIGERVRAELEADDLGGGTLPGLEMEHRPSGIGGPQRPSLPAAIGVVDAAIHPLCEVVVHIGHPQNHELAVGESQQCATKMPEQVLQ